MRTAQILDVVAQRRVVSSSLFRGLLSSGGGGRVGHDGITICDLAARVGLRLRRVVNDNDFLGEAVPVEIVPIGLPRAPTLPGRLVLGDRATSGRDNARTCGRCVWHGGSVAVVKASSRGRVGVLMAVVAVRGSRHGL